jgi:hypothetical protein
MYCVCCFRYFITDHITSYRPLLLPPWRCCHYVSLCSSTTNIMQVVASASSFDFGSSQLYDVKKQKKFWSSILVVQARKMWLFLRYWRKKNVVSWVRMLFSGPHCIGFVMSLFRATWWWHKHEFSLKNWTSNMSMHISKDGCISLN